MRRFAPPTRWFSRLALILTSGFLYGAAFPPLGRSALAWICLIPLLIGLRGAGRLATAGLMWGWLLAASYSSGHWLPEAVEVYYEQGPWVGWLFFVVIASLNAAPYYIPMALVLRRLDARWSSRWIHPWVVASLWTGAELARGRLLNELGFFISNPWAQIGYSQADTSIWIQIASVAGIYALTFAIVSLNAALAGWILEMGATEDGASTRTPALRISAGLAPALFVLVFGALRLASAPGVGEAVGSQRMRVAIVQGNVSTSSRWDPNLYARNFETYLRLSADAIASVSPEVLVWPESAMPFFVEDEPLYRRSLASLLGPTNVTLVAGGPRRETVDGEDFFFNSVFTIDAKGAVRGRSDKVKLVPFGEYFPLGSIEFLRRRFERVRVFHPAERATLLESPLGPAAVATCNEGMLPELVSRRVALGGRWILNPSNDSWAPVPVFAEQMLDMSIVRAVEQQRWLVRASTTGPSAIVDPWGRVTVVSGLAERGWIAGEISAEASVTPYARLGDLFGLLCLSSALFLWLQGRRAATHSPSS